MGKLPRLPVHSVPPIRVCERSSTGYQMDQLMKKSMQLAAVAFQTMIRRLSVLNVDGRGIEI